ncbi:HAD-IA family hydrolase [Corynebacterium timonense]|uniref:Putative hydrolase of the HAD superfamily n=1 Tax=Corynebacterium timonense TaxID=441500 RepID=A0A1H1S9T0_9CORY|nr:HAD-IA family hydrolase [Corynebacterium timonense]SDS44643.1 putative hydrolase of the HAD superfamily [Corynebacterium timonense]
MAVIVFDIGKVIVPEGDRVQRLVGFLRKHHVEVGVTELMEGYWAYRDEYDLGLPDEEYWPKVLGRAGATYDAESLDVIALGRLDGQRNATADVGVEKLLSELDAAGHNLGLLSNAPVSMVEAVRESEWGRPIRVKIFSSEVGVAKPDRRIYEIAERELSQEFAGYERSEVHFFDDREVNVEAAREFGWNAHLWAGEEAARRAVN